MRGKESAGRGYICLFLSPSCHVCVILPFRQKFHTSGKTNHRTLRKCLLMPASVNVGLAAGAGEAPSSHWLQTTVNSCSQCKLLFTLRLWQPATFSLPVIHAHLETWTAVVVPPLPPCFPCEEQQEGGEKIHLPLKRVPERRGPRTFPLPLFTVVCFPLRYIESGNYSFWLGRCFLSTTNVMERNMSL